MSAMEPVDPLVAFVTGASSGIGRGLAVRLAQEGYAVGLAARRAERLQEVAGDIRDYGGAAAALPCDVSDPASVRAAVETCRGDLGPIDLLVANAGIGARTAPDELTARQVETVMAVNFFGAIHAVEAVLPEMLRRRSGHLVAVSSMAGFGGLPERASYAASKAALSTFFESLRLDLRGSGIAVTVISPGFVQTEMTSDDGRSRPFIMEVDEAVERMIVSILNRDPSLVFPRPLGAAVWAARILPRRLYDVLAHRTRSP